MQKTCRVQLFRGYPNKVQMSQLNRCFGCVRKVYNISLDKKKTAYEKTGKNFSIIDLISDLTSLKRKDEFSYLKDCPAQPLQQVLRQNLNNAYDRFFKGLSGFPKFKSKRDKQSLIFPISKRQQHYLRKTGLRSGKIKLPKMAKEIAIRDKSIDIKNIKEFIISKYPCGIIEISVRYEKERPVKSNQQNKILGIDRGVTKNVTTSKGDYYKKPKKLKKERLRLKREQKRLSRKKGMKKGQKKSFNFLKQSQKVSRVYWNISNIRKDFNHQVSRRLVSENQATIFVEEDLKLQNMSRSAKGTKERHGKKVKAKSGLNREILNANLGQFDRFLTYKAVDSGSKVQKVDPKFTSRQCSDCGFEDKGNRRSQSKFCCIDCGFEANADINAAINIARRLDEPPQSVEERASDSKSFCVLLPSSPQALKRGRKQEPHSPPRRCA